MPRLAAEVTTRTEVDLKPELLKQLRKKLGELRTKKAEAKAAGKAIDKTKDELEVLFLDGDEYSALEEGVRVNTPFGEVPMKIVRGKTAPKLNMKKLLKHPKFKLSQKELESCYDPAKLKKEYLGIWMPDEDDEGEDE